MQRTISESDWKLFRQLHALALERFCERVLSEVAPSPPLLARVPTSGTWQCFN